MGGEGRRQAVWDIMGKGRDDSMDSDEAPASRYDDELLSANWNPVVALLGRLHGRAEESHADQIREEDAVDFLGRFYTSGA